VIVVPEAQMKGRREFQLPLSQHMLGIVQQALLAGDVMFPGSPWLLPTRSADGRNVIATRVCTERSLPGETGHILRHTWRTLAVAAGVVGNDAEMLLAHRLYFVLTEPFSSRDRGPSFLARSSRPISSR
jgi:integrase